MGEKELEERLKRGEELYKKLEELGKARKAVSENKEDFGGNFVRRYNEMREDVKDMMIAFPIDTLYVYHEFRNSKEDKYKELLKKNKIRADGI